MKKRARLSEEEAREIEEGIELAELAKPDMGEDGIDLSLLTQKEMDLMGRLQIEHLNFFRRKAIQLRFFPDTLNPKEKRCILRCMSYEELKSYYQILALKEKNRRLQTMLTSNKVQIRKYCRITKNVKKGSNDIDLPDVSIAKNTQRYFELMKKMGEKVYETPYYFLSDAHRSKIKAVYAREKIAFETTRAYCNVRGSS